MNPRVNYTLVGLFVVLLALLTMVLVMWLAADRNERSYDTYVTYMYESVSGLNPNASVKYRGVAVGYVKSIALDTQNVERVRLLLNIEQGTPVKDDTTAVLVTQGITGLAFVELTGGSKESQLLKPRDEPPYPEIRSGPSLMLRLDQALSQLFDQFGRIASNVDAVALRLEQLLGDDNQQALHATLQNLEQVTALLHQRLDGLATELAQLAAHTTQAAQRLPALTAEVDATLQVAQRTLQTVERSAAQIGRTVDMTGRQVSQVASQTAPRLARLMQELQTLTRSLTRISQELEQRPEALFFGRGKVQPGPGER